MDIKLFFQEFREQFWANLPKEEKAVYYSLFFILIFAFILLQILTYRRLF